MQSSAIAVDGYLTEALDCLKVVLTCLCELCRAGFKGCAEEMVFGLPACERDGVAVTALKGRLRRLEFADLDMIRDCCGPRSHLRPALLAAPSHTPPLPP
ncbi:hypothetical protein AB0K38_14220 [Streptomyces griseoincarnatus]|uniref:hypothetical protein n=1 Tax=Streptomyces TaxID=1883 RepID=UPI0015E7F901|nr:hypothetical protein [Streptomyces sp. SMS_SU21]MCA2203655.1 hypothetical protein [Streptomyces sp. SMS_SU21]